MMGHMKLVSSVLAILLVASISTYATAVSSATNTSIHSVQEITQAIPIAGWEQVNNNGFGDLHEQEVSALEAFNGYLYAGTFNVVDPLVLFDGARIFRSPDGVTWTSVTQPGFQNPHDSAPPAILDFVVFGNRLYASTGRGGNPAQIWRASNGVSWAPMVTAGFGDPDIHDIAALAVYNNMIYAGASSQVSGARIYRSSTGDSNTWNLVAPAAPTMAGAGVTGFSVFNGTLYATVESEAPVQIWRSTNGSTWTSAMNNGFGDSNTVQTGGMAVFGGYLYVGAGNAVNGAQLWRTNNGTSWTQAITPAFGDANNQKIETVLVFQNELYVSVKNTVTGMEVWHSVDGTLWEQANQDGFGDSNNTSSNRSSAAADFLSHLFVGTSNVVSGGELWRKLNPNNPPTDISLSKTNVDENQPGNTVVGVLSAADPDPGATFTFSQACTVPGADNGSFNILGTDLRTSAIFDFETKSAYNICIRVTDQGGLFFDKNFVITINNVNEAPTDIALSNSTVDENQPINTPVGSLTATDPDTGATFIFSLACTVAGADDSSVNILGTNLQTSTGFDFETKSAYSICLRVSDEGGMTYEKTFVITVNDVNEAPTSLSLSNLTVDENQPANMVVGALTATDPDVGAAFTFSLACAGADNGSFNILGTNLRTSAVFDFETKSTYNICLRVTDQGGLFFDRYFVVTVNNVTEAPMDIYLSANSVDENQPVNTVVGTLTATDPDLNATFTFNLVCAIPGVDDGSFNILGTNLRTSATFDFEAKSSYSICIRVVDQGGMTFDRNFVVIVNNLNEAPTGLSLSANSLDENQPVNTAVGALTATDPDAGGTFTFSLACAVTGADDGSFNILGTNLQTSASFDFETKSAYSICVRVTDQDGLTFDQVFIVTVNNLNEAPTDISLSNNTVNENQPVNTVVGMLTATDPDAGALFTFGLACALPGADDTSFNINGTALQTSASFNFETKSTYSLCIRVTDQGGLFFDKSFVITVNDLPENAAPTDISLSNTAVDENQPINTVVGMLTAADPDADATFTFSLACQVAGADDTSFNISGSILQTSMILDFETKSAYNICIRVTDQGGLTFDENFIITVNDLSENTAPTDISLSKTNVDEIQPVNTVVGVLSAADPDPGATFTFSLACAAPGADDASFNVLGTDLRTSATFDYETKSTYNICVRVTDQGGLFFDKNFVITVNDLFENTAPTDISLSKTNVDENQPVNTVVGVLSAADPDPGATFTFSLACAAPGVDDASFNVLGTDLRTSAILDFESKFIYNICIRVTDEGGMTFDKNFVVMVKDANDTNTPGKVTGGGNIGFDQGKDKITFGFNISYKEGDAEPKGILTYQDHTADVRLKVTAFDLLVINGNHVWITGTGILNDGQLVRFTLEMDDLSKLGQRDTFYIHIPELNGYEAGGDLTGGSITIH